MMQRSQMIQGFKLQCNINSMDFNRGCSHFATGGKDYIRIFSFNLNERCWFKVEKTYGKYKGTSQTKANVSQLAWNKGIDLLAIGTSAGHVFVYDAVAPYKNVMQTKGHQGDIKNVQWCPNSKERFVTSCFDNQIIEWDIRDDKSVAKYELGESIKIRDLKFNPYRPHQLAVQSSTRLELLDIRKGNEVTASYDINSNELHGIGVKWDPSDANRIAAAISKQINIFDITTGEFNLVDSLTHYSLIKSFHWMKTKPSFFGIMCDKPEKNIVFYDIEDKNRLAYYYAGHQKPMDCWIMDDQETILISVSNIKEKSNRPGGSYAFLVAQHIDNYFDPNQIKFNHPLAFNNDSQLAFCLNVYPSNSKKSSSGDLKKKGKPLQTSPSIYQFRDNIQWFQREKDACFPLSLKEEIQYLAKNYIIDGNNEKIAQNNSQVASKIGKLYCSEMWKNVFQICFPEEQQFTIEAIYERKMKVNVSIVDNRVILHKKDQTNRPAHKIDATSILQWLVDQHNQLQTAALAGICLLNNAPEAISQTFVDSVWNFYIQLLRSLQLYQIAAESILLTKTKKYMQITENDTKYNVTCGSCKLSVSKGQCKCNLLCVICQESLGNQLVIWCKYCGHGGHAVEYQKWFKEDGKKLCPHGCGHACFSTKK